MKIITKSIMIMMILSMVIPYLALPTKFPKKNCMTSVQFVDTTKLPYKD